MFQQLVIPLFAASLGVSEVDDKPFYFRSFENAAPSVDQYRIAGKFGGENDPFALSLNFREGRWEVALRRGNATQLKLRLDKAYNSIPLNRILIGTDGTKQGLIVMIPFGTPHLGCFENGEDVYNNVVVTSDGKVSLEHFPRCNLEIVNLAVKRANGMLEVGPPPEGSKSN